MAFLNDRPRLMLTFCGCKSPQGYLTDKNQAPVLKITFFEMLVNKKSNGILRVEPDAFQASH